MDPITAKHQQYFIDKVDEFGTNLRGLDWYTHDDDARAEREVNLRYDTMLAVIPEEIRHGGQEVSLLDVGCGYGGLYLRAQTQGVALRYTGIDLVEGLIADGKNSFPDVTFLVGDIFSAFQSERFDYIVCNGILTNKLDTSIREFDIYAHRLIKRLFELCTVGTAFNLMTTKLDWMRPELYHRNPVELFAYCLAEITSRVKIDHSYPLFDYTVYLYH